jgi:hypothetical protein
MVIIFVAAIQHFSGNVAPALWEKSTTKGE